MLPNQIIIITICFVWSVLWIACFQKYINSTVRSKSISYIWFTCSALAVLALSFVIMSSLISTSFACWGFCEYVHFHVYIPKPNVSFSLFLFFQDQSQLQSAELEKCRYNLEAETARCHRMEEEVHSLKVNNIFMIQLNLTWLWNEVCENMIISLSVCMD